MPTLITFLAVWTCLGPNVEGFIVGVSAPWTEWSACSRSCGGGDHSRTYNCNALNHFTLEYYHCTHTTVLAKEKCNVHPCPVDGKWGDWMAWSQCSVTCGYGESMRVRVCNNPPPSNENRFCQGIDREAISCNKARCHLDAHWGAWSTWSQCSVTCGTGTSMRSRSCVNQSSAGQSCLGTATETTSCNLVQCDVDGNWSEWSKWSGCTMTCGTGSMSRARICNNPPPANGGHSCNGNHMQTVACNQNACPVDGQWSEWTPYSPCDATCGTGTRSRFRICDNPHPSDDGKYCIGGSFEISSCAEGPCVTPTSHVCNGSKIYSTVILHTSVSHTGDHKCLVNNNHPAEAVLEGFCNAPNKQTWTFHTKYFGAVWPLFKVVPSSSIFDQYLLNNVMDRCQVVDTCSTVSMYTPIGFWDVVAEEEKYGIFMGCTQTGFKLASQDCQTSLHIAIVDHEASKYHVILW